MSISVDDVQVVPVTHPETLSLHPG
jgi:hypothetical protein